MDDYYLAVPDADAPAALAAIRAVPPTTPAYLTVAASTPQTDAVYQALGCVSEGTEPLMARSLAHYQRAHATVPIHTLTVADVAAANMADPEATAWLNHPNVAAETMTHVAVTDGPYIRARARSLRLPNGCSYISMVFCAPNYRGHGYATALMHALLAADLAHGIHTAVLLASPMAVGLYQRLGFVTLCDAHIYRLE
jgi:predicted GNAT family acetyltransferase